MNRMWMLIFLFLVAACDKPSLTGRWMRVIDDSDTIFLLLNADSTFFMDKNLDDFSGTWQVRDKYNLNLISPPRQELYVLSFRIVNLTGSQLILKKSETADPLIYKKIK